MSYTVVGGGLGGLATAFYLRKLPGTQRVILVEASNRIGGWIQTTRHDDGVIYEHGPRTVRPAGLVGANTLSMVEELGLSDNILSVDKSHPAATVRCILAGGELHILPSNLKSLFRKIPPFSKPLALAALQDWRAPQKVIDDESVHEFVSRRLGEDVADFAVDPMIRGICSGDSREISAKAFVLGPLFKMEQESGGIVKAMLKKMFKQSDQSEPEPSSELVKKARGENWSVWSLENGLEQFPEVLRNRLEQDGIEFELGSPVERIVSDDKKEKGLTIVTNKSAFQSDHVFLTTPAFASSSMTESLNFYLSKTLASIPYVTVAVINIEYPGKVQPLDAFGFLVPSNQRVPILGAVFDTCCFSQGDRTIFTVMMGGRWFEEHCGKHANNSDALARIAVAHLAQICRISIVPQRIKVSVQKNCIAQYTVGHLSRVENARKAIADEGLPISLVGSSFDGVGINDVIMSAKRQVESVAAHR